MQVEVNFIAVCLAAIAAMVIGGIWYSKAVFGAEWMKLAKISEKKAKEGATRSMIGMALMAFVASYALAHFAYLAFDFFEGDYSFMEASLITAGWAWLAFVVYGQIGVSLFEQRPQRLMLINAGNSLVTFLVMGIIIGMIGV